MIEAGQQGDYAVVFVFILLMSVLISYLCQYPFCMDMFVSYYISDS